MKMILMLLLTACGVTTASLPVEPPPAGATAVEAPTSADGAIAALADAYRVETGVELPPMVVHWSSTKMAADGSAWGLTYSCDDIWVYDQNFALRGTPDYKVPYVLAHEIGHCARRTLEGDGDPQHADGAWWPDGAFVDRADLAMRAAGY